MQILVQRCNRGLNLNLENLEALSIRSCCKSLSRWMMQFLQRKCHRPPSLPSSPSMKSSTWVVGMNATPTRWGPCCILVCRMTTSQQIFMIKRPIWWCLNYIFYCLQFNLMAMFIQGQLPLHAYKNHCKIY